MSFEEETWKPAKNFELYYLVSSHGRVKSSDRYVKCSRGNQYRLWKGRFLKQTVASTRGYYQVSFSVNGKTHKLYVHRIVAETFKEDRNETVNHIDGNKLNNHVSNLEWISYSNNNKHAFSIGLKSNKKGKK